MKKRCKSCQFWDSGNRIHSRTEGHCKKSEEDNDMFSIKDTITYRPLLKTNQDFYCNLFQLHKDIHLERERNKMPIFIAKTYDGKVESVVLAKSYELAQAYWQGKDIYAHSVDTFTEDDLKDHSTGVLPIVKTEIKRLSAFGQNEGEYLVISND